MKDSFLPALAGLRAARLSRFGEDGLPLVRLAGDDAELAAVSIMPLSHADEGRELIVAEDADGRIVVLGCVQPPVTRAAPVADDDETGPLPRAVVEASRELVLKCGKASLRLSADGRITVRGREILTRADGQNRVQGAHVSLN